MFGRSLSFRTLARAFRTAAPVLWRKSVRLPAVRLSPGNDSIAEPLRGDLTPSNGAASQRRFQSELRPSTLGSSCSLELLVR